MMPSTPGRRAEVRARSLLKPSRLSSVVTHEQFRLLLNNTTSPQLKQSLFIAFFTGLRPSEVFRVLAEDFDHENLILRVKVEKTRKQPFTRLIAIPRPLSVWIMNNGAISVNEHSVANALVKAVKRDTRLEGIRMESFRRNFASVMEKAGVSHEFIDGHQGRHQSSVITKHYLRDPMRCVDIMRPYIQKVFEGDDGQQLHIVQ